MSEALRYWEARRLVYNALLVLVVVAWCTLTWPHFQPAMHWGALVPLAVLALGANLCYSAVYLVELSMRAAPGVERWRRLRWLLFTVGTLLALLLANYWIADEIYPYVRQA
jgi:hypothetical protein